MSKLPFKKKTAEEEEEYETDGEEELEDLETSNEERTQFIQTSDLAEEEAEELDEEEDEESDEPQGLKDKIQWQVDQLVRKIKSLGKKKNQASSDEEEELDEDRTQAEIKKPDQKKRLIQGLIVIALVYFIADEFLKEETVPEAAPQLKARPDQVPVADTPVDPAVEEAPAPETTDSGLSEAVIADPSDTPTEGMPTDTITDTETTETTDTVTDTVPDTTTDIVSDTPPTQTNDSTSADDQPIISEDSTSPTPDEPSISEDYTPPSQPDMDQVGQGQAPSDVFGDLSSPIGESEGDLTEKILQDLETQTKTTEAEAPAEYVAPPDYEYQGRGLVYNCKALHWACVDGPSYKVCEQNSSYLQQHEKAPECYPFNIYETTKGCTNMQNRMVSSGASTDFCKNF